MAAPAEPGVSHALAIARAGRLSNLRYSLAFVLKDQAATVAGTETLTFDSAAAGDLPIDYRDGTVQFATLNGKAVATELVNGHLMLPAVAGANTLTLAFTSKRRARRARPSRATRIRMTAASISTRSSSRWMRAWPSHASTSRT